MIVQINKDIEKFRENAAMGLTFRELIYSGVALAVGAAIFLPTYKHIGMIAAVYLSTIFVAPIAISGFYQLNGIYLLGIIKSYFEVCVFGKPLVFETKEQDFIDIADEQRGLKRLSNKVRLHFRRKESMKHE